MKNNNLLMTVAVIFIVIAGIGWLVTSQATNSIATQQGQLVTTPLVNKPTKASPVEVTNRQTDYNGNHHRNNGRQCHDGAIN